MSIEMKVNVTATKKTTTRRVMELTAGQVESTVKRWAILNHGFSDAVKIESYASFDGLFSGMELVETHTETDEGE